MQDLQNDSDVVWLAESFAVCSLDEDKIQIGRLYTDCSNDLMKYVHRDGFNVFAQSSSSFFSLKQIVIDLLKEKEAVLYRNHFLRNRITPAQITELKEGNYTLSFDFETLVEIQIPNTGPWLANDVLYSKIKQAIYYNNKLKGVQIISTAIAPVVELRGQHKELFWLPIDNTTPIELENDAFDWVNRTSYNIYIDSASVVKEELSFEAVWEDHYSTIKDTSLVHNYYKVDYFGRTKMGIKKMDKEALANFKPQHIDRIVNFDPTTFEPLVKVDTLETEYHFFLGLKLYQDWAWDKKKKKLLINQRAYAPIYSKWFLDNNRTPVLHRPRPYLIKVHWVLSSFYSPKICTINSCNNAPVLLLALLTPLERKSYSLSRWKTFSNCTRLYTLAATL